MARLLECVHVLFVGCCLHLRGPAACGLLGAQYQDEAEPATMKKWWLVRRNNKPIDGVMAEQTRDAIRFAECRNVFRTGDNISVSIGDPVQAYELATQRDDQIAEVRDFMVELGFPIWPAPFMTRLD
jgi:hypothetical protein